MARIMAEASQEKRPAADIALYYDAARENPAVAAALAAEIEQRFGPRDENLFSFALRDAQGALVGGLNGAAHWSWFYIRHLWVAPERRGEGLAALLLKAAEAKARERACLGLYIDTFEEPVAAFYERRGFRRAGAVPDFPPGAARFFLYKPLAAAP